MAPLPLTVLEELVNKWNRKKPRAKRKLLKAPKSKNQKGEMTKVVSPFFFSTKLKKLNKHMVY